MKSSLYKLQYLDGSITSKEYGGLFGKHLKTLEYIRRYFKKTRTPGQEKENKNTVL